MNAANIIANDSLAMKIGPQQNERTPHERGDEPAERNEEGYFARGSIHTIRERSRDRKVPIERDEQETGHTCITHRIVETQPHVANVRAEKPLFRNEIDARNRPTNNTFEYNLQSTKKRIKHNYFTWIRIQ